jgi:hypothetical protein
MNWQIRQTATIEETLEIARVFSGPLTCLPGSLPVAMYRPAKSGAEIVLGLNLGTAQNRVYSPAISCVRSPTLRMDG